MRHVIHGRYFRARGDMLRLMLAWHHALRDAATIYTHYPRRTPLPSQYSSARRHARRCLQRVGRRWHTSDFRSHDIWTERFLLHAISASKNRDLSAHFMPTFSRRRRLYIDSGAVRQSAYISAPANIYICGHIRFALFHARRS